LGMFYESDLKPSTRDLRRQRRDGVQLDPVNPKGFYYVPVYDEKPEGYPGGDASQHRLGGPHVVGSTENEVRSTQNARITVDL